MGAPKPCGMKRDLLRAYMAALEKLKVAQREHEEILAGRAGESVASRSTQRIEVIKALASSARMRFSAHRHEHRC